MNNLSTYAVYSQTPKIFTKTFLPDMSDPQYFHQFLNSCSLPCVSGSSGVGQDVSRSPHGVGMNDFDLLKVLGTGGDFEPIYCLLLYFYGFGESYSVHTYKVS